MGTDKDEKTITKSFAVLLQEMWKLKSLDNPGTLNHGVTDPSSFRQQITRFAPKFSGFEQHDSQEFLQYALEGFHSELNRNKVSSAKCKNSEDCDKTSLNDENDTNGIKVRTYEEVLDDKSINAEEKGRQCLNIYLSKEDSFITDLFLGQFRSTLKCMTCKNESVTFEPFWVVSVPIPTAKLSREKTISDCMELFVKDEMLDGEERPTCEKCKERRKCQKWYSVERWPQILVVHLKRFAPVGSYRSKLSEVIQVPLKNLNVTSFSSSHHRPKENQEESEDEYSEEEESEKEEDLMLENGIKSSNISYNLYAISNHSGTLHGGHYTAYCRHPFKGFNEEGRQMGQESWHLYNDRAVSGANPDHVISGEAYLLFFEQAVN